MKLIHLDYHEHKTIALRPTDCLQDTARLGREAFVHVTRQSSLSNDLFVLLAFYEVNDNTEPIRCDKRDSKAKCTMEYDLVYHSFHLLASSHFTQQRHLDITYRRTPPCNLIYTDKARSYSKHTITTTSLCGMQSYETIPAFLFLSAA